VQILCLGGEQRDALIAIAVSGRAGDAKPGTQQRYLLALAEPDEDK
jgi:hypothetical protein